MSALTSRSVLSPSTDLICFSHLRWGFVFQRPQHLMVRFARQRRVFFVEEPIFDAERASVTVNMQNGVHVVVPHLPPGTDAQDANALQSRLIAGLVRGYRIANPLVWFYTPMALPLLDGLTPSGVIYDCMDELSGFRNAPPQLTQNERALMARADVMFTGGHSLFEAKRHLHPNIHPCPSSVDVDHFARARSQVVPPVDQQGIARPRLGFCGVIDERMDLGLVRAVAERNPGWQLVMLGPTAKIDPADLPQGPNIHYLGMKQYDDLPAYFAGWDVALLPFAHNDATRYISPTKTPEYLAAGVPVVSTSIRDVVRPYGERGLALIADTADDFIRAIATAMTPGGRMAVQKAQSLLATMSWDRTFEGMCDRIAEAVSPSPEAPRPARPARMLLPMLPAQSSQTAV